MKPATKRANEQASAAPAPALSDAAYSRNRSAAMHWLLRSALFCLVTLLFQARVMRFLPFTGDEPHYVMTTISLLRDHDFNLANNYRNDELGAFGWHRLPPQRGNLNDPFIPPPHGVGFSILMALPYALLGFHGIRYFLILMALSTSFLVAAICDRMGLKFLAGTAAGFLLVSSPAWQMHASRMLPECFAGFLAVIALLLLQSSGVAQNVGPVRAFVTGLVVALPPFVYPKYASIALAILVGCLATKSLRSQIAFHAGLVSIALVWIGLNLKVYGSQLMTSTGASGFSFVFAGLFTRLSANWFDKAHGVLPYQPAFVLAFWAVPTFLVPGKAFKQRWVLFSAALAVTAYFLMYGLLVANPGESMPGRYGCSSLPLMAVLIAAWVSNRQWKRAAQDSLCILGAIGFASLLACVFQNRPPWQVMDNFRGLFRDYWGPASFLGPPATIPDLNAALLAGLMALSVVVLTKTIPLLVQFLLAKPERRAQAIGFWNFSAPTSDAGRSGLLPDRPIPTYVTAVWSGVGWSSLAAGGFLMSLLYLFRQLACAGPQALAVWLNSDTMWMYQVLTDKFRDHYALSGWTFSIAPFWFPDFAVTGIFWLLVGNPNVATLLAGFAQIVLLAGALHLCHKVLSPDPYGLRNTFLLGACVAVTLYVGSQPGRTYPELYRLFVLTSHAGSLVMFLCALGFGLVWIKRRLHAGDADKTIPIVYGVVCLLGGLSNLMFFVHFLLPFSLALWLAQYVHLLDWKQSARPILVGWLCAAAGVPVNRYGLHATDVSAQSGLSVGRIASSLDVFLRGAGAKIAAGDPLHLLAITWFAICLGYTVYGLRFGDHAEGGLSTSKKLTWILLLVCLLSTVCGISAIVLGGSNGLAEFKDYAWTMHYWQPTFFLPLFGLPLVAAWIITRTCTARTQRRAAVGMAVLSLLAPAYLLLTASSPTVDLATYRPPIVQFVDEVAAREGLHYGYAGYWQARPITMLSRYGVRAYAVDGMLNPLYWVSNRQWYVDSVEDRTKPPKIDFVVLDDIWKITRETAVRALGEPQEEIPFENTKILIYPHVPATTNVPAAPGLETPLASFEQVLTSSMTALTMQPGQQIRLPVQIQNPGSETWVGYGRYPVAVSYKWFDAGKMLPIEGERTAFPGAIRPGEATLVNVRVVAPGKPGRYVLRITLVQEAVAWFMTRSNMFLELPVTVN